MTTPAPSTTFDATGKLTLSFNGVTLLNAQALLPIEINTIDSSGVITHAWIKGSDYTSKWDATANVLTWTFAWGTLTTTFTTTLTGLDLVTLIRNTSTLTIAGVGLYYYTLQFPQIPLGMSGGSPSVVFDGGTDPAVVVADFGSGAIAIVNPDPTQLYAGFYSTNLTAQNNAYQLWIAGTPKAGQAGSWPVNYRKIAPGGSDTYRVSLRCAPTGTTAQQIAPDAFANVAKAVPFGAKHDDRRPIGYAMPAGSSAATRSATNPNGWLNDPKIDVTTPAGLAAFATRLLAYIDGCITTCKGVNAQALILWDAEGEGSSPYVGDPRQILKLAPEWGYHQGGTASAYPNNVDGGATLLEQCCRKIISAGVQLGFTVRHTQHELVNGQWVQDTVTDPAALLIDKIAWMKANLGAKIAYIDSYVAGLKVNGVNVLQTVAAAHPDVLLIPEHFATCDFASSAPYIEARNGALGTPSAVKVPYPGAFGVVNISGLPATDATNAIIQGAKASGDMVLFRAWSADPANALIATAYQGMKAPSPAVDLIGQDVAQLKADRAQVQADETKLMHDAGVAGY